MKTSYYYLFIPGTPKTASSPESTAMPVETSSNLFNKELEKAGQIFFFLNLGEQDKKSLFFTRQKI